MIKIKVRTRDKLEALTSNKDFVNVFGERRARVMGSLSRKKVENHKLESQTTKPSLALNPGRSSFCKVSLSAICSDKKLKFDASALKAFYIRNLNLVNSFDTKFFFCKPEACLEGKKTNLQYCCMLFVTFLCRN